MTVLLWIWVVVAVIAFVAALILIGVLVYVYLEDRESNDAESNAARARDVLMSFLGPIAALLWPLTLTGGLLYGGYRLLKTMREDLKTNQEENN